MTKKTEFKVTSKADFVAGVRSPGDTNSIWLTDEQARYPIIHGEIKRIVPDVADAPTPADIRPAKAKG